MAFPKKSKRTKYRYILFTSLLNRNLILKRLNHILTYRYSTMQIRVMYITLHQIQDKQCILKCVRSVAHIIRTLLGTLNDTYTYRTYHSYNKYKHK